MATIINVENFPINLFNIGNNKSEKLTDFIEQI